jgi:hypothetical protein
MCRVELHYDNAYTVRRGDKSRLQNRCKSCNSISGKAWQEKNKEREQERRRRYYAKNKERINELTHRGRIKRKYGLTPEEVEARKLAIGGLCECCGEKEPTAIDHCHVSGVFRGLLCNGCNTALGMMGESVEAILALAAYAERFQTLKETV